MAAKFSPGKDWSKETEDLYIHKSGTRIAKTTYRGKLGWWLMPLDLDEPAVEFAPTDEGRAEAFEAHAKGPSKRKKKSDAEGAEGPAAQGEPKKRRGRKPKPRPEPEDEEQGRAEPPDDEVAAAEADEDDDEGDDDEAGDKDFEADD